MKKYIRYQKMTNERVQAYFDSDDTIMDVFTKLSTRIDIANNDIKELQRQTNQALFSIDMLIKSINNYIKEENNFSAWYYSQPILRKILWKITNKKYSDIRQIYNNKQKQIKNGQ